MQVWRRCKVEQLRQARSRISQPVGPARFGPWQVIFGGQKDSEAEHKMPAGVDSHTKTF